MIAVVIFPSFSPPSRNDQELFAVSDKLRASRHQTHQDKGDLTYIVVIILCYVVCHICHVCYLKEDGGYNT